MMPNNKTIFFSYIKPPFFSGQSASTDLIIRYLEQRGWECKLLPLYPLQRSIDNPFQRWYQLLVNQVKLVPKLQEVFKSRNPILHISLGQSFMSFMRIGVWLFPLLLLKRKIILAISLNGSTFMKWEKGKAITKLFLLFLKKAKIVSVLGDKQRQKLISLGVEENSIEIVCNTSELNIVSPEFIINKHKEKEINLLHLSLMVESKGFPEYLEAIYLLAQEELPCNINAILCGPLAFTNYCFRFKSSYEKKQWIENKISAIDSLNNPKLNVKWIPGAKGVEKEKLFRDAHIFVMPTSFPVEAQPLVLLEALSSGSTIISTKVGEIESAIDSSCAILIDEKSPETLLKKIEHLIDNSAKRTDLSLNGLEKISGPLSLEHYIDTWESIFKKFSN